jgi:hypothetical protein
MRLPLSVLAQRADPLQLPIGLSLEDLPILVDHISKGSDDAEKHDDCAENEWDRRGRLNLAENARHADASSY